MILNNITELSIYEAQKVHELFLKALSSEEKLVLDMGLIEKIDIVGLQLLLSLLRSASESDKKVSFINCAENVLQQIKLYHCDKALGLRYE